MSAKSDPLYRVSLVLEDVPRLTKAELEERVLELERVSGFAQAAGLDMDEAGLQMARRILATALHGVMPEAPCARCLGHGVIEKRENGRYADCPDCTVVS